jgi:hypothetical protein
MITRPRSAGYNKIQPAAPDMRNIEMTELAAID